GQALAMYVQLRPYRPIRTSRRSPTMTTVRTTAAIVSNVRVRCRRRSSRLLIGHLRILLTNARVRSCFVCSKISCGWPSSKITPPSMKTIRLATLLANPISWVTTIIVIPSWARAVITSSTSRIYSGSKADVGSSNSMALGSIASALAIAARVRFDQEVDASKERALARSARADDDESLAFRHVEAYSSENMKRAEVLVDVLHADHTETPSSPLT